MSHFLLTKNNKFFDKENISIISIYKKQIKLNIPNKNSVLFFSKKKSDNDDNYAIKKLRIIFDLVRKKHYKYIIIMSRTLCLNEEIYKKFKIPKNIKYIYIAHVKYKHKVIKFLPLGRDFRSKSSYIQADKYDNKDILCYCNFSLNTHIGRKKIYNNIKNKSFITFESMNKFLNYKISRNTYFERLGKSKFVICPRGKFIDSYRFYDALYSGAIPIVVREKYHNLDFYKKLPILFLNSVEEFKFLTRDYLNKKYEELIKYKKDYYEGLDFKLFIEKNRKILRKIK